MSRKFSTKFLKEYTQQNRLAFMLHWSITESCNLNCTHCCVPKKPKFVDLKSAQYIIQFLKEQGFFLITLSGGECLLHPNFEEIYMALKRAGMYISIFTNGTTLTEKYKRLFREYPPRKVEVSVYGIDDESFKATTGANKGYNNFLDALNFFKEQNIRTIVKTPITKKNCNMLNDFIDLANKYNAEYKFGTFVFPALDGDKKPLNERLDYKEAVELEFSDENALDNFCNRVNKLGKTAEPFQNKCGACTNSFTLNADNSFSFCGMMIEPKFYFKKNTINKVFEDVKSFRDSIIKQYEQSPCYKCNWANACPGCPAHLLLEKGTIKECNQYFFDITKEKLTYAIKSGKIQDVSILE